MVAPVSTVRLVVVMITPVATVSVPLPFTVRFASALLGFEEMVVFPFAIVTLSPVADPGTPVGVQFFDVPLGWTNDRERFWQFPNHTPLEFFHNRS